MFDRYSVREVNVCTFNFDKGGCISTNLNQYPELRLCVIDRDQKIAIDVLHQVKYDYLETFSYLYFLNGTFNKVKDDRRAAIFSYPNYDLEKKFKNEIRDIINKLENGYEFCDGNDIYSNEKYLELLEKEKQREVIDKAKTLIKKKY